MKTIIITIFLFATTLLFSGTATDITGLYYTGLNANGGLQSAGFVDSNWSVTYANVNNVKGDTTYMGDAYVVSAQYIDPFWVQNTGSAQWIVASGASTAATGGTINVGGDYLPGNGTSGNYDAYFIYTLEFEVIGTGGGKVNNDIELTLTMAADDQYAVYINPKLKNSGDIKKNKSIFAGSKTSAWSNTTQLTIKNFGNDKNAEFNIGTNYLSVIVDNTNSIVGNGNADNWNPSGFLMYQQYGDIMIDGNVIPESSTYGAVFMGFVVFGVVLYRKKRSALQPAT